MRAIILLKRIFLLPVMMLLLLILKIIQWFLISAI